MPRNVYSAHGQARSRVQAVHPSSIAFHIAVTVGCATLAACDPGEIPAGSYFMPQAVIAVRLDSDVQSESVRLLLNEFARTHGLHRYRYADDPLIPLQRRQGHLERARMTEYNPPMETDTLGFDFVLVEITNRCWAVTLHDRTGNWMQESVDSFYRLHRALNEASGRNAFVFVRPTVEQNWARRQQLGTAVDPQQPERIEDLCLRMGLDEPRDQLPNRHP
jgi:hypothetical protein